MAHRPRLRLFATDLEGGGGTEGVLRRQLPTLLKEWDVEVVATSMPADLASQVRWHRVRGVPRRPAWLKWSAFWVLAGGLGLLLRHRDPKAVTWATGCIVPLKVDAITLHFCHAGYVRSIGSWTSYSHGWRALNSALSRRLALAMERWSMRPARLRSVLVVSPGLKAEVNVHYPDVPVTVTPNGVDVPDDLVRSSLPMVGPLRAIFVGGDWARKGLPLAIRALAEHPTAVLTVVGTGSDSEGPSVAIAVGVADRVTFTGYQSDVRPFLIDADALLLPSAYETFSLVVFEAAAYGVVPIVTPVHGARDLVEHDVSGLVLKERSVAAVLDALERLDSDRESLNRMSWEAHRRAKAFSWDRSITIVNQSLTRLI